MVQCRSYPNAKRYLSPGEDLTKRVLWRRQDSYLEQAPLSLG